MSLVAANILRPFSGKRSIVEERLKKLGAVFERYGANVKTTNFVAGEHAGCIGLMRSYPDFKTASAALLKAANDPEGQEIRTLRETDPAGEMLVNRQVGRTIFGEGKWASNPVSTIRRYAISRAEISKAMPILEGVQKIMDKEEVNVRALVPVFSPEMSRLIVSYQFKSLDHLGEVLDTVSSGSDMQALIEKANTFSSIEASSVMVSF
tara:strand:- start:250 stop:873 length:624 start_codon:yes stop_codon:yes gene_type:complete